MTICLLNTALCNTQTKILPVREGVGASSRYRVSERSLQFRKLPLSITTVILNMYCRLALFLHLNKPSMGFENGRAGKSWCFAEEVCLYVCVCWGWGGVGSFWTNLYIGFVCPVSSFLIQFDFTESLFHSKIPISGRFFLVELALAPG